jgi:photosystem II stability/assembly factor-like uncharacterized protein
MKRISILLAAGSLACLPFLLIHSGNETPQSPREKEERKAVNDWFLNQRIYPYGKINYEYYKEALASARNLQLASRSASAPGWVFAGPTNVGGRITDIEMHASDMQVVYAAAASGGVFKSTDQGGSWTPIFDQNASLSIGDIAIAPSNANIIYVGTGEPNNGRGSVTYDGQGIYKSTDAGQTWTSVGLQQGRNTGRIAIHPTNANILFTAQMGDLFGTGPDRGIYRSTNGGTTWSQVLFVNDSTGGIDVCIDPQNPNTVYATTWTRIRRPTYYNYGGTGSNVYKSTDGGTTWTLLTNGLPANNANVGKISIDISPSSPNVLYTAYSDPVGAFRGMYKTTNGGTSWSLVPGNNFLLGNLSSTQFFWGGRVRIDPANSNIVYIADFDGWKTTDGGASWVNFSQTYHVDHHITYVHPADPNLVLEGTDGGFFLSSDGGVTWTTQQTLPITQFYTCEVDNTNPSNLYGGTQDNGTVYTPTGNVYDWTSLFGGDGFYVLVNPINPSYQIYEYQYGNLSTGMNGIDFNETSAWNTPMVYNPLNPQTVFYGRKSVYRSTDHGYNWNAISPDLTKGPQTGNLTFHNITSLSCSKVDSNIIWAGCDDGNVQVTTNGGGTWTDVSSGLPVRWITRVAADPVSASRAYVTVSGFRWHEYLPHVLMTNNYGATWTDITNNLPQAPCNDIIVDPTNNNFLYVATDMGVYYSINQGGTWQSAGTGLPLVPVTDLVLHNGTRTLIAATYGRGMFTLDLDQLLGAEDVIPDGPVVSVFPNPVAEQFTVKGAGGATLRIYSAEGKLVLNRKLESEMETVQRGDLPAGVYFYQVEFADKKSKGGKLIFR